jgi:hypothetical protein
MANFLAVLEGKNSDPLSFLKQASESLSLSLFSLLTAFPYKFGILSQYSVFFGQIPALPRKVTHINHLRTLSLFPLYLWLKN